MAWECKIYELVIYYGFLYNRLIRRVWYQSIGEGIMYEYTPKNCESITIKYSIASLGSPATWDDQAEDPDIDIESIEINGIEGKLEYNI